MHESAHAHYHYRDHAEDHHSRLDALILLVKDHFAFHLLAELSSNLVNHLVYFQRLGLHWQQVLLGQKLASFVCELSGLDGDFN